MNKYERNLITSGMIEQIEKLLTIERSDQGLEPFSYNQIKNYINTNRLEITNAVNALYYDFKNNADGESLDDWCQDYRCQEHLYDYLDADIDESDDLENLEEEIYYQGGGKYKKTEESINCGQYSEADMELFMRGFVVAYPGENKIEKECDLFMTMKGM